MMTKEECQWVANKMTVDGWMEAKTFYRGGYGGGFCVIGFHPGERRLYCVENISDLRNPEGLNAVERLSIFTNLHDKEQLARADREAKRLQTELTAVQSELKAEKAKPKKKRGK